MVIKNFNCQLLGYSCPPSGHRNYTLAHSLFCAKYTAKILKEKALVDGNSILIQKRTLTPLVGILPRTS
jgi:hypothetical protein